MFLKKPSRFSLCSPSFLRTTHPHSLGHRHFMCASMRRKRFLRAGPGTFSVRWDAEGTTPLSWDVGTIYMRPKATRPDPTRPDRTDGTHSRYKAHILMQADAMLGGRLATFVGHKQATHETTGNAATTVCAKTRVPPDSSDRAATSLNVLHETQAS